MLVCAMYCWYKYIAFNKWHQLPMAINNSREFDDYLDIFLLFIVGFIIYTPESRPPHLTSFFFLVLPSLLLFSTGGFF